MICGGGGDDGGGEWMGEGLVLSVTKSPRSGLCQIEDLSVYVCVCEREKSA